MHARKLVLATFFGVMLASQAQAQFARYEMEQERQEKEAAKAAAAQQQPPQQGQYVDPNSVPPPPPATRQDCEAAGGFWSEYSEGRTRTWGCIMDTVDANKVCNDGSQCQSHYCVTYSAYCDGKLIDNPRGSGLENCTFNGSCYGKTFPPKGCFGVLERGVYRSLCID